MTRRGAGAGGSGAAGGGAAAAGSGAGAGGSAIGAGGGGAAATVGFATTGPAGGAAAMAGRDSDGVVAGALDAGFAATAPAGGFTTTGPAGGLEAIAGVCGGGTETMGAAARGWGTILRGAGFGGSAIAAGGASGTAFFGTAVAAGLAGAGGAGCARSAASCSFFCRMAFSTSPGLETLDRSIFGLGALSARDPAVPAFPRCRWARTRSASSSSSELECVFFSVTPTASRTSRMALLLTSSSRAKSLIRTLLIRPFCCCSPDLSCASRTPGSGFSHCYYYGSKCRLLRGLSNSDLFGISAFLCAALRFPVAFFLKLGGLRDVLVGHDIFFQLFAGVVPTWSHRLRALVFNGRAGFRDFLDLLGGHVVIYQTCAVLRRRLFAFLRQVLLQRVFLFFQAGVGCGLFRGNILFAALSARHRLGTLFARLVLPKVMPNRRADLFQRLFSDARNLLQLLRRHVGQRLDGGNARRHQLLDNAFAQLRHLLNGCHGSSAKALHLLLDFLALLFLALDVDLPAQKLGRQPHVLALLADGERELGVVHNDLKLLFGEVGDADAAYLGRLQSLFGKGRDFLAELDDVDLLAAQLANDRLHAHTLHTYACAHRVHILVAGHDGDLGTLASFAGNGTDGYGTVVNLRNLALEQVLHQFGRGAGNDDLRPLRSAIHPQKDNTDALAHGELLQTGLLAARHPRLGLADVEDYVLRLDALYRRVQNLADAVVVFVEYRVALGFADLLEDDLLGHLRGDAAEHISGLVVADFAAHLDLRRQLARFFQCDLVQRVLDLLRRFDHGLVDVGADFTRFLVQLRAHVLLSFVVLARGEGDGVLDGSHNDLRFNAFVAA